MNLIKEKWLIIVAALAVIFIMFLFLYNPYSGPDFIAEPVQIALGQPEKIIYQGREGAVELECLAEYQITAAVKSIHSYATDYASQVSPWDVVLAWGDLNASEVAENIHYSQSGRWYYFRYDNDSIVDQAYIQEHSANVHLIPADHKIESQLKHIRRNDTVQLEGYLVSAHFKSGSWTSSLTREDAGDGSCEIMYVTKASIE